jgi:hypothetical protein
MKIFFFQAIKGIEILKVGNIGYIMLEDSKKHIKDVVGTRAKNISYIYLNIRKYRKDIGGHWKGPQKIVLKIMKSIKKDITDVRNINVLMGEKLNFIF